MIATTMLEINDFALLASDAQIEHTMQALEANNIHAVLAENGADAKKKLFEIIPANAEVFTASSMTLETLGIPKKIDTSGQYDSVRIKLAMMDRATQNRKMQTMGSTPEFMIGSVHAVTETGSIIVASMTGSQLAGYASGAANVIWVVGTQKIVPTLEAGLRRIEEYVLPLEDTRVFKASGIHSSINKLLIVNKEFMSGRTTLILVKEKLGF